MQRDYRGSQAALDLILKPPFYFGLLWAANLARIGDTEAARKLVEGIPAGFEFELFARSEANMCALAKDAAHWKESLRMAGVHV